jgi:hypothetical protein
VRSFSLLAVVGLTCLQRFRVELEWRLSEGERQKCSRRHKSQARKNPKEFNFAWGFSVFVVPETESINQVKLLKIKDYYFYYVYKYTYLYTQTPIYP